MLPKIRIILQSRIFENIVLDPETQCWLWQRPLNNCGYGQLCWAGLYECHSGNGKPKTTTAHRAAWELFYDDQIPPGIEVCHTCDVRHCLNPAHLWLGTHTDNMQDAARKRRIKNGAPRPYRGFYPIRIKIDQVLEWRRLRAEGLSLSKIKEITGHGSQKTIANYLKDSKYLRDRTDNPHYDIFQ